MVYKKYIKRNGKTFGSYYERGDTLNLSPYNIIEFPLKLAALFHGKFERIHLFEDGNGRVGRFLINVILTKNKYSPLIIRKSQRIAYLSALEAFDQGYTEKLERFLLEKFKATYKNFFEVYFKYL